MKGTTDTCAEAAAEALVNISVTERTCASEVSLTSVIISFDTEISLHFRETQDRCSLILAFGHGLDAASEDLRKVSSIV